MVQLMKIARSNIVTVSLVAFFACPAFGQSVEVGASIGRGCVGSEGSQCGDVGGRAVGGYVAVWFGENFAVQAHLHRIGLPDRTSVREPGTAGPPYQVRVERTDRSRTLLAFQAQYHFGGAEHPVRFFVQGGLAPFADRMTTSCTPAGCETLPRHLIGSEPMGTRKVWHSGIVFGGGLAARLPGHLILRGTVQSFNLGGDALGTSMASASLGYRF